MPKENYLTIKEMLFNTMERIASHWPSRNVTVIIFAESDIPSIQSMVGYHNNAGNGTILYISATPDIINHIMATAWDAASHGNNGRQSNP